MVAIFFLNLGSYIIKEFANPEKHRMLLYLERRIIFRTNVTDPWDEFDVSDYWVSRLKQPGSAFSADCLQSKINSSICSACFTVPYCCYASRTEGGGGRRKAVECAQMTVALTVAPLWKLLWANVPEGLWADSRTSSQNQPAPANYSPKMRKYVVWSYRLKEHEGKLCMFVFIVTPDDRSWHIPVSCCVFEL